MTNHFKIALRRLIQNSHFSIIHITGLAIGIAVSLIIWLLIQYHTSFDTFHTKKNQIYRVLTQRAATGNSDIQYEKSIPLPLPAALKVSFPACEQVVPIYASYQDEIQVIDSAGKYTKKFKLPSGVFYTEPSFFEVFDFPLLAGTYTSIQEPNHVLLTQEIAESYFGDWQSAMGKTLQLTGSYRIGNGLFQFPPLRLTVTGVLASIPANTDFQLKAVIAFGTDFTGDKIYGIQKNDWKLSSPDYGCFVSLAEATSVDQMNRQLNAQARVWNPGNPGESYLLQPLQDIHFDAVVGNYSHRTISHELIRLLWMMGIFILLIACINFINLSTAQATYRGKEVGVRKVLGSKPMNIRAAFLTETVCIVLAAVVLAVGLCNLIIPVINKQLDLSLTAIIWKHPGILGFLALLLVSITWLAGIYPAIILSRFQPIIVLKANNTPQTRGIGLRRGLVFFQFVIAQVLLFCTLIMIQQMNFFMNKPMGFDSNTILNLPFRPDHMGGKTTERLRQELLAVPGVETISFYSNPPAESGSEITNSFRYNGASQDADFKTMIKFTDPEYTSTYQLKLKAGRNLLPSDRVAEFIVNESFVRHLGLQNSNDVLQKELSIWGGLVNGPVVGVLLDFNDRPLQYEIAPLILTTNVTMYRQIGVKLNTQQLSMTMQAIKKIWENNFPDLAYQYHFVDDQIKEFYKNERTLAFLYKLFAGLAIFLSCLGLYGLATFMAAKRAKEIGIRKVLGATAIRLLALFSTEYIYLIMGAFLIAVPMAWWVMHQWLQQYVYRIQINPWIFLAGGVFSILIALATVGIHAMKAALSNPVTSLRSE
jgi:putative ABC transport system permease protein